MNFRLVFKLTGKTLLVEAGALLLPLLVCLFYRENPLPFLLSIAMTGAVGLALSLIRSNDHFFPREGFFAVALIWLLMSAFGALPFFFSGFFGVSGSLVCLRGGIGVGPHVGGTVCTVHTLAGTTGFGERHRVGIVAGHGPPRPVDQIVAVAILVVVAVWLALRIEQTFDIFGTVITQRFSQ